MNLTDPTTQTKIDNVLITQIELNASMARLALDYPELSEEYLQLIIDCSETTLRTVKSITK